MYRVCHAQNLEIHTMVIFVSARKTTSFSNIKTDDFFFST